MRKKSKYTASIWREGKWYVAQCLEVDVASQGTSESAALKNLADALALHFSPPYIPQELAIQKDIGYENSVAAVVTKLLLRERTARTAAGELLPDD